MIRHGWVFAAIIVATCGQVRAGKVCDLTFTDCPGRFKAQTVQVPSQMIWLDAKIPFCTEFVNIASPNQKPPSVVFIIDNSGSMDENDPETARFDVVSTLLENIFDFAPAAQVGLVVFTRRLAFDHRENAFFKTAFPGDTTQHDSFVPLTALNAIIAPGVRGIDTLKAFLKHDDKGNLTYVTKLPASRNNSGMGRMNTRDGTDISLGFSAAKLAMLDSKSDKANQFFVFLSDGVPSTPDNGREGMINDFIAGVNTPATFTVFFDTENSTPIAPSNIVTMTANIRVNGYSTSNPKSSYWAVNQPGTQLQTILQQQVLGNVLTVPAKAKQAALATGDSTYRTSVVDPKNFVFAKRLALSADTTRLELDYTYTYVDTTGGKQTPKDKTEMYPLTFVRSPAATAPTGMTATCSDQADISLYHDGQNINLVTADDENLEARLTMPDGSLCQGCSLEITPSSGRVKDEETPPLMPGNGYMAADFGREVSLNPAPGDGRLQHLPGDSIVVLYVSPLNPLDVVRKAFPYADVATMVRMTPHNDFARAELNSYSPLDPHFVIQAPVTAQILHADPMDRWIVSQDVAPTDSLRYVGLTVEASRAFSADVRVFSNQGEFVDKVDLIVPQEEFAKLDKSATGSTRKLKVLWNSRTRQGGVAATGSYVIKTTVTLIRIPGIADDQAVRTDYRKVGVLRML